jgi:hypothetical protein
MAEVLLEDLTLVFKSNFEIFDLALSDSMITRSNFLVPTKGMRRSSGVRPESSIARPAPNSNQPTASSSHTTAMRPLSKQSMIQPAIADFEAQEVNELPEDPQSLMITPTDSMSADVLSAAQCLPLTLDNLTCPVPRGSRVSVDIRVSPKGGKTQIFDAASTDPLLFGCKDGKVGSFKINVIPANGRKLVFAEIRSNLIHSTFFARADVAGTPTEIAAIRFKLAQKNTMVRRRFTAYIPKADAASPAGDSSWLLKHKDMAVKMTEKPPMMKGGYPVLYFGGRVKASSTKNHILINDLEEMMIFGKAADGHFIAEVLFPMSPLQAICLSLVHLR